MNNIFIIGITPRSGTNYLYNLLKLHPDCEESSLKGEDFLLYNSDLIVEYIDKTHTRNKKWNPEINNITYGFKKGFEKIIFQNQYYKKSKDKSVINKTPYTNGIINFPNLFNNFNSRMIIIIRDGKDTSESYQRTFGKNEFTYDNIFNLWNKGARDILIFDNKFKDLRKELYIIIKYEDLVNKEDKTFKKILEFVNLSVDKFDFDSLKNIGVIGSSTYHKGKVTWSKHQKKTKNFNPLARSKKWKKLLHWRFHWIAGKNYYNLGYSEKYRKIYNPFYYLYNLFVYIYDIFMRLLVRIRMVIFKS